MDWAGKEFPHAIWTRDVEDARETTMTERTTAGLIELDVTDFGPISRATVELRPLTVFVGPSNTGKSWLAVLVYALHRFFSRSGGFAMAADAYEQNALRKRVDEFLSSARTELDEHLARAAFESGATSSDLICFTIPGFFADPVRWVFDVNGGSLAEELRRCLGVDGLRALVRKGRAGAGLDMRPRLRMEGIEQRLIVKSQQADLLSSVPEGTRICVPASALRDLIEDFSRVKAARGRDLTDADARSLFWRLLQTLADLSRPHLFGPLCNPAFYLPAGRNGIMQTHSVGVKGLIGRAAAMAARRQPPLSGVFADFLEQLIDLGRASQRPDAPGEEHARRMEEIVLGGSVHMGKSEVIDYPAFTYRPQGWKDGLPLMNAASMVSELAPVVLYLRYLVEPGHVLIVEEPESHLHPAMQVEFTRLLASLVRAGIRVVLTTHSEWVLEELSNIVLASELPEAGRDSIGSAAFALQKEDVGVWAFGTRKRSRGTTVRELTLDNSGGLYSSDFDEVSTGTYNDWVRIANATGDGE